MSEEALIERLLRHSPTAGPGLVLGPGDDAAVGSAAGPPGALRVLTTDSLVEGVHFRRGWGTPHQLGRKALAVNLSDIAAMGARPTLALLSVVAAPEDLPEGFARGFGEACREHEVLLAGGNVARAAGGIVITVTCEGLIEAGSAPLRRDGAAVGDDLHVSGELGWARVGLRCLEAGDPTAPPEALRALLDPRPRVELGLSLARMAANAEVHAAMDLSDGLAADLPRLCAASGVGAVVRLADLPAPRGMADGARLAAEGGEDYELLVAAPPSARGALEALGLLRIGRCVPIAESVRFVDAIGDEVRDLTGFDHHG